MLKLKNYLIVALLCAVAVLAFGLEPIARSVNEALRHGTLTGAEKCMSYSSGQLLSEDAAQTTCVSTFQTRLYHNDHATGRAGPRLNGATVAWGGTLENKSSDHVTTWIRISVSIFDDEGEKQEVSAETKIWIDPLDKADFQVDLLSLEAETLQNFEFCDLDDEEPKSCMGWGVTDVMGLRL